MSYGQAIRLVPEPVRSRAFGSITGSYTLIGSAVDNPIRIFMLQNLTDATLMFSLDGVHDHIPLPASGFLLVDVTANKTRDHGFYLADGTGFYVKEIDVPSTGNVYVTVFYGRSGGA